MSTTLAAGLTAGAGSFLPAPAFSVPATQSKRNYGTGPLGRLREGNRRWVSGRLAHRDDVQDRRRRVAEAQHPFAVVFSCIDSRVPPEYVFDTDLGDLFVVRTAGESWDPLVSGSIEYGPAHGVGLVMVLGHSGCGAVKATIEAIEDDVRLPGYLPRVVEAITPAYHAAKDTLGTLWPRTDRAGRVEAVVAAQVDLTVRRLRRDPVLGEADVTGGIYSLRTGEVAFA